MVAAPCVRCGCLKSNHGYWMPKGWSSRPCGLHGCSEYKGEKD